MAETQEGHASSHGTPACHAAPHLAQGGHPLALLHPQPPRVVVLPTRHRGCRLRHRGAPRPRRVRGGQLHARLSSHGGPGSGGRARAGAFLPSRCSRCRRRPLEQGLGGRRCVLDVHGHGRARPCGHGPHHVADAGLVQRVLTFPHLGARGDGHEDTSESAGNTWCTCSGVLGSLPTRALACLPSQSGWRMRGTGLSTPCMAAGMVMIFWMALPSRSR